MSKYKPVWLSKYKLVWLRFLDHSSGSGDSHSLIPCEVFGILKHEDETTYTVCSWICDYDLSSPDTDAYCVIKSAVIEYKELEVSNGKE